MTFLPLDTHVPWSAFNYVHLALKVAMLKLLFEFDVVTFAQEIMSVQGQLTLSTYDVRLTFESGVISTSYQYVH